jgi:hypothetical protein
MPFFKASLGASVVVDRHRCLWLDSSRTTITLLVKSELTLFVATFAHWASLYLVKLLSIADAILEPYKESELLDRACDELGNDDM